MSKKQEVLDYMVNQNDRTYNLLKISEELQELSLALTQTLSKEIPEDKVIEEIGDVEIRMKVLNQLYPKKKIKERIRFKINKFYKYIKENKYKNI